MKTFIYTTISKLVKKLYKNTVVSKTIKGFNSVIYYEKAQHLNFLFQKEANYEGHLLQAIRRYIKRGDVIFDIGANIGQYALPFSELVGKEGKIVAFEPDSKNYAFLQFNVQVNKCANVICENYGLGATETVQEFYRDTETGGRKGSFKLEYVEDSYTGITEQVVINTLDSAIATFGAPNFIKIDIEGFEADVLSGLTKQLTHCIFFIEVRPKTQATVFEFFKSKGFVCFCIDSGEQEITSPEQLSNISNLLFYKA
ncbi:FkbM family methyltransferase [Formosa sp. A9]|uniref:FkbM family methyltransferase n=1 Tax=Formosa sp. A9 TaxID=3442641 RepID=UPI003EB6FFFA